MNDLGVSPVVGTVLLIAIMLITVTALMMWGVPAIQQMERQSQWKAVRSSFEVLDGIVDEVLPETGSARLAQIPLQGGSVAIEAETEPFAVAWSPQGAAELTYGSLGDDDTDASFNTSASVDSCVFRHFHPNGTFDFEESVAPSAASSGTCTATRNLNATHHLRMLDGSGDAISVAWIFHPGRIRFESSSPAGPWRMDYHNGAVTSNLGRNPAVHNPPLILQLAPDGLTVGVIDLNASGGSAGGEAVAQIQVELRSTRVVADARRADRVDVYPLGSADDAWRRFLETTPRYEFDHTSGDLHVRYEPGSTFPVTLTHYTVQPSIRGVL